jgi:hypothetical protein
MKIKYLDIAVVNEQIGTIGIERKDKEGNIIRNEYAQVNERIKAFRMLCPGGAIETELLSNENGICVFKAIVKDEEGRVLGTGTAYEKQGSSFINQTSYIENCETSAVGRALGMLGLGIDVSVASAEEVQNAIINQTPTKEDAEIYKLTFGKYTGKTIKEVYEQDKGYIDWILGNSHDEYLLKVIELITGKRVPTKEEQDEILDLMKEIMELCDEKNVDLEKVKEKFKVEELREMTLEQMRKCVTALKQKGE